MGVNPRDLKNYICSKGVATVVPDDCTLSTPISLLCIRFGLSLGGVKERYLKYKSDRHNYFSLCAYNLDSKSTFFAFSPYLFDL